MHTISRSVDARIAKLFASHGLAFTIAEAEAVGVSASSLDRRVRSASLSRPFPGVITQGGGRIDETTLLCAALKAAGPESAIAGVTSLRRHDLFDRDDPSVLHVLGLTTHPRRNRHGVIFHATAAIDEHSIVELGGLRHQDPTSACLYAGRFADRYRLAAVVATGVVSGSIDVNRLQGMVERNRRAPGNGEVRAALDLHMSNSAGTRSRTEDRLLGPLRRQPFPLPLVNTRGATGHPDLELDFVWAHLKAVVEVDGTRTHELLPGAAERDQEIDRRLRADGWRVLRIPAWMVWTDLPGVLVAIRAFLGV